MREQGALIPVGARLWQIVHLAMYGFAFFSIVGLAYIHCIQCILHLRFSRTLNGHQPNCPLEIVQKIRVGQPLCKPQCIQI